VEGGESWWKHVGEGESMGAGSMTNRPVAAEEEEEEGVGEQTSDSKIRPGC
jgi:hypothetical protein